MSAAHGPAPRVDRSPTQRAAQSGLRIRVAQHIDAEPWAALYREYRAFYQLEPDESVVRQVWEWITDGAHELGCLVANLGDDLVGLAHHHCFVRPALADRGLHLDDLFVDPAHRRRGVGLALMRGVGELAIRHELSVVRWITAPDNEPAARLFDRLATARTWVSYDMSPHPPPSIP